MFNHWPLAKELEIAKHLAVVAGKASLKHYQDPGLTIEYKDNNPHSPVTTADKEANAIIVQGLKKHFPHDAILAEESVPEISRLDNARLWCIDPIDGTQEFIAKNGQFMVMIGLAIERRAALGILYQPTEKLLCYGIATEEVQEAYMELGEQAPPVPLQVSQKNDLKTPGAVAMVSRAHPSKIVQKMNELLGITNLRPVGSVGLKIAYLARGLGDIYASIADKTHEWDTCGPEAVLLGAGGMVTDLYGAPILYNKPETLTSYGLLGTNGFLHAECLQALKQCLTPAG